MTEDTPKDDLTADQQEAEDVATESLARVYEKQKYYSKAIDVYKKLILKYPQKKSYFAEQIENLKQKLQ